MADNEKAPIFAVLEYYGLDATDPGSGRFKCLCPFHDESRPSASVDVDKQRFRCFACDIQGDAIDIVMQQEGLEYAGAVEFLETHFGFTGASTQGKPVVRELRTSLHISTRGTGTRRKDDRVFRTRRGRKLR